jgi:hypothetical protein
VTPQELRGIKLTHSQETRKLIEDVLRKDAR